MRTVFVLIAFAAYGWPEAHAQTGLDRIRNIVVIFAENRSFDALYGTFPGADGLAQAERADIVESVVGGLYGSIDPYLPFTAASTLAGSRLGGGAFGFGGAEGSNAPLPFVAAALLVAGIAIALSAVAAATTVRRDVT